MAKEYVEIVPGHFPDQTLKEWIARGMRYLVSLPPKLEATRKEPRANGPLSVRTPTKKPSAAPKSASAAKKEPAEPAGKAKAKVAKAKAKVASAKTKTKTKAVKATAKVTKPKARAKAKAKAKPARAAKGRAAKKTPARRVRR